MKAERIATGGDRSTGEIAPPQTAKIGQGAQPKPRNCPRWVKNWRKSEDRGAQGRNRTTDTAIFSRMLYQLSYLGTDAAALEAGD
jgi:hypothetical protein